MTSILWYETARPKLAEVTNAMAMTVQEIVSTLQQRIADGTYPGGGLLPSASQLRAEFGIAEATARRALARLEELDLATGGGQGRQRRVTSVDQADIARTAVDYIRAEIAKGSYPPGSVLPSEAELIEATGQSRYAVREALNELERAGEVLSRPGRRRQVAGGPRPVDALYEQLEAAIRADVEQGRLTTGTRVGSEAELGERFAMSRVTVRRALVSLEKAGVLTKDAAGRRVVA